MHTSIRPGISLTIYVLTFLNFKQCGSCGYRHNSLTGQKLNYYSALYNINGGATFESDSSDPTEDDIDDRSKASLQYMITNRMRQILIDELSYLPSEVDQMDPQVAAVVIERGLTRPTKGMPSSWKVRGSESPLTSAIVVKGREVIKRLVQRLLRSKHFLIGGALAIVSLASIIKGASGGNSRVGGNVISPISGLLSELKKIIYMPIQAFKSKSAPPKPIPVNVRYLDQLRNPSWIDLTRIKLKEFTDKFV